MSLSLPCGRDIADILPVCTMCVSCVCVSARARARDCVCVCVFCIVMRETLSISFLFLDNIFHLDVHYVCMLVQRFEPQGRRFTNVHYRIIII